MATSNTQAAQPNAKNGQQVTLGPFRGGTQPTVLATGNSNTVTLNTGTQDLPDYEIKPTNILRCIYIEVTATASGNSASVAFQPDAPLNILSTLNFKDSGGTAIVGAFDTYTLSMAMKYFGYLGNGDPRQNAVYSVTTGTGATGGSFNVVFRIPVEVNSRTGIAALQNQNTTSPLVLSATVNKLANIYSTAPTAAPTVKVTYRLGGYWNGPSSAYSPTPKAFGTTQYISRASNMGLNGSADLQLPPTGLGNPWRNLMFLNYATGGARAGAGTFPDPIEIKFRGNTLVQHSVNSWQFDMSEYWDLGGTIDTGTGLDTGVFVLPFDRDFGQAPGSELGLGYLDTAVGDAIEVIGSWSASSTLYEVVNFVALKDGATLQQIQGLA
jgi:hypothetical protein